MQSESDILLLQLIRKGDQTAFKKLFDDYFPAAVRYIGFYIRDYQAAEQIAIDIFAYIWENSRNIEIKLTFKAYIMTAARNRSLNWLRDRKETSEIDSVASTLYSEDCPIEAKELDRLISEAVGTLPAKCAEVFNLSRRAEKTNKEIALLTGTSVKTVEAHITKALKAIQRYLGETYSFLW
ncbi:MAG: RNA polymerase sigma-70 factor [Bacteroidales bacterium]|nr:RNA polymerase sigma-70 factor [Bacteroidales bacterium]